MNTEVPSSRPVASAIAMSGSDLIDRSRDELGRTDGVALSLKGIALVLLGLDALVEHLDLLVEHRLASLVTLRRLAKDLFLAGLVLREQLLRGLACNHCFSPDGGVPADLADTLASFRIE